VREGLGDRQRLRVDFRSQGAEHSGTERQHQIPPFTRTVAPGATPSSCATQDPGDFAGTQTTPSTMSVTTTGSSIAPRRPAVSVTTPSWTPRRSAVAGDSLATAVRPVPAR